MRLVDSHCHLDFPDFEEERDAVIERARARGVERFVTISTRVRQFARLEALTERYEDVYASILAALEGIGLIGIRAALEKIK